LENFTTQISQICHVAFSQNREKKARLGRLMKSAGLFGMFSLLHSAMFAYDSNNINLRFL
jgi:hypothetical protein